jgi:hypothetical protein
MLPEGKKNKCRIIVSRISNFTHSFGTINIQISDEEISNKRVFTKAQGSIK